MWSALFRLLSLKNEVYTWVILLVALRLVKSSDYIVKRSGLERSDRGTKWPDSELSHVSTWRVPLISREPTAFRHESIPSFPSASLPATKAEDWFLTSDGVGVGVRVESGVTRALMTQRKSKIGVASGVISATESESEESERFHFFRLQLRLSAHLWTSVPCSL